MHEQFSVTFDKKEILCILMQCEMMYTFRTKAADQHLLFHYIDSTNLLLSKSGISSLRPSSVGVQPCLCWTWSETTKTGFLVTRLISAWLTAKVAKCSFLQHFRLFVISRYKIFLGMELIFIYPKRFNRSHKKVKPYVSNEISLSILAILSAPLLFIA